MTPLVGGLEHESYDFPSIGNVIIPTDFHSIIFQRARWLNHQPAPSLDRDLQPLLLHHLANLGYDVFFFAALIPNHR